MISGNAGHIKGQQIIEKCFCLNAGNGQTAALINAPYGDLIICHNYINMAILLWVFKGGFKEWFRG